LRVWCEATQKETPHKVHADLQKPGQAALQVYHQGQMPAFGKELASFVMATL